MQVEGLRRKRLAVLKKRKTDLKSQIGSQDGPPPEETGQPGVKHLADEEHKIDREIGILHCARHDIF